MNIRSTIGERKPIRTVYDISISTITFLFWLIWSCREIIASVLFPDQQRFYIIVWWGTGLVTCGFLLLIRVLNIGNGPLQFPHGWKVIASYLFWVCLSLIWSNAENWSLAAFNCASLIGDVGAAILLISMQKRFLFQEAWYGLVCGALCNAGYIFFVFDPNIDIRSMNTIHPAVIAHHIAIGLLCLLYFFEIGNRRLKWILFASVLYVSLVLSTSKTSIIALSVALAMYVTITRIKRTMRIALVLIIIASLWITLPLIDTYIKSYVDSQNIITLTGRLPLWADVWHMIKQNPFLGYGFASFYYNTNYMAFSAYHAHNELLQQWFTLGIPGVCFTVGLYTYFLRWHWNRPWLRMLLWYCVIRGITEPEQFGTVLPLGLFCLMGYIPKVAVVGSRLVAKISENAPIVKQVEYDQRLSFNRNI